MQTALIVRRRYNALKTVTQAEARSYIESLSVQSALIIAVSTTWRKGSIKRWSSHIYFYYFI